MKKNSPFSYIGILAFIKVDGNVSELLEILNITGVLLNFYKNRALCLNDFALLLPGSLSLTGKWPGFSSINPN